MNKRVIDDFLMDNELSMKDSLATARKFSSIILFPMREIINNPLFLSNFKLILDLSTVNETRHHIRDTIRHYALCKSS